MMFSDRPIREMMFKNDEIPLVREDDLFREALEVLNRKKLGIVCVINGEGVLRGVMTDGNVRRIFLKTQDPLPKLFVESVGKLMNAHPITIAHTDMFKESLKLMNERLIWVLPVVDEQNVCVGLFHMQWALKALLGELEF